MATEFGVDFRVLEHLRGYPEELRRYANLMKQSHPRGQSAVEFLLRRPSSGDFVEAAESAGLPPREFLDRLASRKDFPAPLFRKEHRALWARGEVDAYLRTWKAAGQP